MNEEKYKAESEAIIKIINFGLTIYDNYGKNISRNFIDGRYCVQQSYGSCDYFDNAIDAALYFLENLDRKLGVSNEKL